jgi:hypothetical protein
MAKKDDAGDKRRKDIEKNMFGPQKPSREEGTRCTGCGGWYGPGGKCDGCR